MGKKKKKGKEKEKTEPESLVQYMDYQNVSYIASNDKLVEATLIVKKPFKDWFDILGEGRTKAISPKLVDFRAKSHISVDYLSRVIALAKEIGEEYLTIESGNDYPFRLSCEKFTFVIAPKIETE